MTTKHSMLKNIIS